MEKILNVFTNYRNGVTRTLKCDVSEDGKNVDITILYSKNSDSYENNINLSPKEAIVLLNHLLVSLLPHKAIITRKRVN